MGARPCLRLGMEARGSGHRHAGTGRDAPLSWSKKHKLWVWKAFCRDTRRLAAWALGGRDEGTAKNLMKRVPPQRHWATDDYPVYAKILPRERHSVGKANTHHIESNNASQRARFARFHRKTHAFSRSLEMVHLTMVLFATYHVNGNCNQLLSLVR